MSSFFKILFLFLLMSSLCFANSIPPWTADCHGLKSFKKEKTKEQSLEKFFEGYWKYTMQASPLWATFSGYPGYNDQWPDVSFEKIEEHQKNQVCQKEFLSSLDLKKVSPESRLSYDLMMHRLGLEIESHPLLLYLMPLSQMSGLQTEVSEALLAAPQAKIQDYEDRLKRLLSLPTYVAQVKDLLRVGRDKKMMPPRLVVEKVITQFEGLVVTDLSKNPLYQAFADMPTHLRSEDIKRIQTQAQQIILKYDLPSLQNLKDFLIKEYLPASSTGIAVTGLPQGQAIYNYLVRYHTTTTMNFSEIHELGLREVERITREMNRVRLETGFKGDQNAFHKFLRTDKRFYFEKEEELVTAYRDIAKRIDPELPKLFLRLPRLPYGVRAMASFKAPSSPTAYYIPGSFRGSRAGYFEANTYDLTQRPRWEMEVLTTHEAVPGHHLQISLAQEMTGLPEFRREMDHTAFIEGWALYCEGLGERLGLYKDLYSKFGALSYELWRAVRLVVDTGMHAMGWSREQAFQYAASKLPKPENQIATEIDRYIAYPGQALAYKMGQMKILQLRQQAEEKLGDRFDIREFHEEVLKNGSVPLSILEKIIGEWIESKTKIRSK